MSYPFPAVSDALRVPAATFQEAFRLQFITHCTAQYNYVDSARLALMGGCRWIQLRMKGATPKEFLTAAQQIEPLCRQYNALFLLNDHPELVRDLNADGVHLGLSDMPIRQARQLLGDSYIIGGTANTFEDILHHYESGATYIGCGPFRFTTTKKNLSPILGLEGYTTLSRRMQEEGIHLPLVAIGGITVNDIAKIFSSGPHGIALSSTILQADDPIEEMRKISKVGADCIRPAYNK